jgi:glycosyltransferase involved in cell wall biosynthesis
MEGLPVQHGRDVLVANASEDFAQCVVDILRDSDLRRRLSENAQSTVRAQYAWEKIAEQLVKIYAEVQMKRSLK